MLNHNLIIGVLYSNYATLQLDWLFECPAKNVGKKMGTTKCEKVMKFWCKVVVVLSYILIT